MTYLPEDDFRARRNYLADEDFALVEEGSDPPLRRISEEAWRGMLALTDDVVLRTTSFLGPTAEHCYDSWAALIGSFPQGREEQSPAFEALLDLADHLQAASFSALHGYYRQAFSTLRTGLEVMIVTTRFALVDGLDTLRRWRYEDDILRKIQPINDLDVLADHPLVQALNLAMSTRTLAEGKGAARTGWAWDAYELLSKFTHVTPGYTDGELWRSNGPVYVPNIFVLYIREMREVLGISALLARIADTHFSPSPNLLELLTLPLEDWVSPFQRGLHHLGVELPSNDDPAQGRPPSA